MYCNNCGQELKDGARFCSKCGNYVSVGIRQLEQDSKSVKKGRGKLIGVLWCVCMLILLGTGGFYVYKTQFSKLNSAAVQNEESERGYIDKSEKEVRKTYFAVVRNQDGKYGYIDANGDEVISCQYDIAEEFGDNGMARVGINMGKDEDGEVKYKYGYINEKGDIIIPIQYKRAYEFSENGLAAVENIYGKFGFINEKGVEVIPCQYFGAYGFSENGLAAVEKEERDENGELEFKWGYINGEGVEVIPSQYDQAFSFTENGFAVVGKKVGEDEDGDEYKYGYINRKGKVIIDYQYDWTGGFLSNGVATTRQIKGKNKDGKLIVECSLINEGGKTIVSRQCNRMYGVLGKSNLILVEEENGVNKAGENKYIYGWINEKGDEVIRIQYDWASGFFDGETPLSIVGKEIGEKESGESIYQFGCIDEKGREIIAIKYDDLEIENINADGRYNGWIAAKTQTGSFADEDVPKYTTQYFDFNGHMMMELSDKYTNAGLFVKVIE